MTAARPHVHPLRHPLHPPMNQTCLSRPLQMGKLRHGRGVSCAGVGPECRGGGGRAPDSPHAAGGSAAGKTPTRTISVCFQGPPRAFSACAAMGAGLRAPLAPEGQERAQLTCSPLGPDMTSCSPPGAFWAHPASISHKHTLGRGLVAHTRALTHAHTHTREQRGVSEPPETRLFLPEQTEPRCVALAQREERAAAELYSPKPTPIYFSGPESSNTFSVLRSAVRWEKGT